MQPPFFSLSLFLQLYPITSASQSASPIFIKVGAYARYTIDPAIVSFPNGSAISAKNDTVVVYSWNCVDLNSTMAKLRVSVEYATENATVDMNTIVYADTLTGDVFFSNGTLIGRTCMWVESYPFQNEKLVLFNVPQANLVGYIDGAASEPLYYDTPQGVQKVFSVRGNGTIDDQNIPYFMMLFDFDTGIMLFGFSTVYEPTFVALGIKNFYLSQLVLVDTNIDLGPAELSFTINAALPYIAVIVAFVLITTGIYFTKRKNKRRELSSRRR